VEAEEYARIAAVEDEHWWYRNTRGLMGDLLAPWLRTGQRILDAGCGPGGNGAWLADHGEVVGVDIAPEALAYVRDQRPTTAPVRASVDALPFASHSFDLSVAITVVTCVPDDARAVRELARVTKRHAPVLLWEPAFRSLRRGHDVVVHSRHRYRRHELAALAVAAGLHVERATYAYSFLAPPALALGGIERVRRHQPDTPHSDVERRGLDRAFAPLAGVERRWLRRHSMPFGTSTVVLATKP